MIRLIASLGLIACVFLPLLLDALGIGQGSAIYMLARSYVFFASMWLACDNLFFERKDAPGSGLRRFRNAFASAYLIGSLFTIVVAWLTPHLLIGIGSLAAVVLLIAMLGVAATNAIQGIRELRAAKAPEPPAPSDG